MYNIDQAAYKHYAKKIGQLDNGLDEKTNLKLSNLFRKNNPEISKDNDCSTSEVFFIKARGDGNLEEEFHNQYDGLLGIDHWGGTYVPLKDHVNWEKLFPEKDSYPRTDLDILDAIKLES